MTAESIPSEDYNHPVAYDAQGQPLYAHPPLASQPASSTQPQLVHLARLVEPAKQEISLEIKLKHDKSKQLYPVLNLSAGEYVISAVRRHTIGVFVPLAIGVLLISLALSLLFNYDIVVQLFQLSGAAASPVTAIAPVLLFVILVSVSMYTVYYVYINNKFFLTNECIIQEVQLSLFSHREQTVNLSNIEDISYEQRGIIQELFNYGSIRLSTEGEGMTYRMSFVADAEQTVATLNNAVEAFKNGRPVGDG